MEKLKGKGFHRILALLLALVMIVGILPIPRISAEEPETPPQDITLTVTDRNTKEVLQDASVSWEIIVGESKTAYKGTTGEDGKLVLVAGSEYQTGISVQVSVTKDGYNEYKNTFSSVSEGAALKVVMIPVLEGVSVTPYTGIQYTGEGQKLFEIQGAEDTDEIKLSIRYNGGAWEERASVTYKNFEVPEYKICGTYTFEVIVIRYLSADHSQLLRFKDYFDVTIAKADLPNWLKGVDATYIGDWIDALEVVGPVPENVKCTYTLYRVGDEDPISITDTIPKIKKAGNYKIVLEAEKTGAEAEYYNKVEKNGAEDRRRVYSTTIAQAEFEGEVSISANTVQPYEFGLGQQLIKAKADDPSQFCFEIKIEYTPFDKTLAPTTAVYNSYDITLDFVNGLKRVNAGTYHISGFIVRLDQTGNKGNYENQAFKPFDVVIQKNKPKLGFADTTLTANGSSELQLSEVKDKALNFKVTTTAKNTLPITYRIVDAAGEPVDASVAEIDSTGKLNVYRACSLKIVVSQSGNNNYEPADDLVYYLTVSETENLVSFKNNVDYVFGSNDGVVSNQTAKVTYAEQGDTGEVRYALDAQTPEDCGLTIAPETGELTINDYKKLNAKLLAADDKTFTVTVCATKAAVNGQSAKADAGEVVLYGEDDASYTVTIRYAAADAAASYTLLANPAFGLDAKSNELGWYNAPIYLKPADDYQVAIAINEDASSFTNELLLEENGIFDYSVYLRNQDGEIFAPVSHHIQLDTSGPQNLTMEYIDLRPEEAFQVVASIGYYQAHARVTMKATDATSGVKCFEWRYVRTGESDANAESFTEFKTAPAVLVDGVYVATVELTEEAYGQMNGYVEFRAIDVADNPSKLYTGQDLNETDGFVIDTRAPKLVAAEDGTYVTYSGIQTEYNGKLYFKDRITGQFTINEANFFPEDVQLTVSKDGTVVKTRLSWENDGDLHTGTFVIPANKTTHEYDGEYRVVITYTDRSTNSMETYTESRILVIDTTAPAFVAEDGKTVTYTEICGEKEEDHKLFFNDAITAEFTIKEVNFFANQVLITVTGPNEALEVTPSWTDAGIEHTASFTIPKMDGDYKLRISYKDYSNNDAAEYKESNTLVIDTTPPVVTVKYGYLNNNVFTETSGKQFNENGKTVDCYAANIVAQVTVVEHNFNPSAVSMTAKESHGPSASTEAKEEVVATGGKESNGDTHTFYWTITKEARYDDIKVSATDLATNQRVAAATNSKILDKTKPAVTGIDYNTGIQKALIGNEHFYSSGVTINITLREQFFFAEDPKVSVTLEGAGGQATWKWYAGNNVDDVDDHVLRVTIPAIDGHYTIHLDYTDRSGNVMNHFQSDRITVDMTAPQISIDFNDEFPLTNENYINGGQNAKYFRGQRTATITVVEHNFDAGKVEVITTPAQGAPAWTSNGDRHTATVVFADNGSYTFDVKATDIAGNTSGGVSCGAPAWNDFVIDKEKPVVSIDSALKEDQMTSFGTDADLNPTVKINDNEHNLEGYKIKLTGMQRGKAIEFETGKTEILLTGDQDLDESVIFAFAKDRPELDGLYTLEVQATDKADNTEPQTRTFVVNRFGSVYEYDQNLLNLIADGGSYAQTIDEDLTMDIYNPSPIDTDDSDANNLVIIITCDGRPITLTRDVDYTFVLVSGGEKEGYHYLLTLKKEIFEKDGIYTISVTTNDGVGVARQTGKKEDEPEIRFTVDNTKPQITSLTGLEKDSVKAAEHDVSFEVYDAGGLAKVEIWIDDELYQEPTTSFDDPNNFSGSFKLKEKSTTQHVRLVITDIAGNVTDTDVIRDDANLVPANMKRDITVSSNLFVLWFANKPLFFGSIGGAMVVLGGAGALIARKKKKSVTVE